VRKTKNIIPYDIIASATSGDVIAMNYIVKHFEGYLVQLSQRRLFDDKGNAQMCVDQEIKGRLEMKLMQSILKFDANIV